MIHLNEGHAALAPLALAVESARAGEDIGEALVRARARTVFTTHTPVPAGNDSYPSEQVSRAIGGLAEGVMYAILLGNAVSPLIDNLTQPRAFGAGREQRAKA